MPSHALHRKWQKIVLGDVTEIDKIIDFPEDYFDVQEDEIREAIWNIQKREPVVDLKHYKKWLRTHDQWRDHLLIFLYIILMKIWREILQGGYTSHTFGFFCSKTFKVRSSRRVNV